MENYLNDLMQNYELVDTSSDEMDNNIQSGGASDISNVPTGSFPPIFLCNKSEAKKSENDEKRSYATSKNAASIAEILKARASKGEEKLFSNID